MNNELQKPDSHHPYLMTSWYALSNGLRLSFEGIFMCFEATTSFCCLHSLHSLGASSCEHRVGLQVKGFYLIVILLFQMMQEEIFGPILPVLEVNNYQEAINFINAK